jgi:cyanophycinase
MTRIRFHPDPHFENVRPVHPGWTRLTAVLVVLVALAACAPEPPSIDRHSHWPDELRINGAILVAADRSVPEAVLGRFLELANVEENSRIGIAPGDSDARSDEAARVAAWWRDRGAEVVENPSSTENLTGLWLEQPDSGMVRSVVDRGGVVLVPGANGTGRGLIPGAIVRVRGGAGPETLPPRHFGVRLDEGTVLELRGRRLRAITGRATLTVPAANGREAREVSLEAGRPGRANQADLTAWRREAIERTLPPFPAAHPPLPFVRSGTLVVVGGGGLPGEVMDAFVEAAGGENARLVFVPASEADEVPGEPGIVRRWRDAGVESATWVHTKDRAHADTDEEFLAPLREATGIWFGGGRQWNFSDSYYGTTAHRLMLDVLERGGAIGGSSAGASIQARHMARGDPLGNQNVIAPGYERGLGFIDGVSIDQHFSERNRLGDMEELVAAYPQLLGIGVDEATALVVRGSIGEVLGRSEVHFYDRRHDPSAEPVRLPAGGRYDLWRRRVLDEGP